MDAAVMSDVRRQRRPAPASCAGLQSRQFLAHAGDAGADQDLVNQVGQNWFRTIEAQTLLPQDPAPLLPDGQPGATGSLQQFAYMIERQVSVMTTADIFLLMAAVCGVYMFVTLVLPVRTSPHTSCS